MELGGSDMNQLKAVLDIDKAKSLILCTSVIPKSLTCARNCRICSKVVFESSAVNLTKSGTQKPLGYGTVSKYSRYNFW
jgi:hypothetical protein